MPSPLTLQAPSPKAGLARVLAVLWTAVVLLACWLPGGTVEAGSLGLLDVPGLDKVVHAVLFFLESYLLLRALPGAAPPARALRDAGTPGRISCWRVTALAGGLAILTEVVQLWVPNRDGSLADFLADLLGILLGCAWYLHGRGDPYEKRAHP